MAMANGDEIAMGVLVPRLLYPCHLEYSIPEQNSSGMSNTRAPDTRDFQAQGTLLGLSILIPEHPAPEQKQKGLGCSSITRAPTRARLFIGGQVIPLVGLFREVKKDFEKILKTLVRLAAAGEDGVSISPLCNTDRKGGAFTTMLQQLRRALGVMVMGHGCKGNC
eukprot:scaffold96838_cov62-Cyclotella_meneghiniana.AAC.2